MNIPVLFGLWLTVLLSTPAMGNLLPVKTPEAVPKVLLAETLTEKTEFGVNIKDIIGDFVNRTKHDIQETVESLPAKISAAVSDSHIGISTIFKIANIIAGELGSLILKLEQNLKRLIAALLDALSPSTKLLIDAKMLNDDLNANLLPINRTAFANLLMECFNRTLITDKKP